MIYTDQEKSMIVIILESFVDEMVSVLSFIIARNVVRYVKIWNYKDPDKNKNWYNFE